MIKDTTITTQQAVLRIEEISGTGQRKGWEYFGRIDGKNCEWLPSETVVNEFKRIIGDKWGKKKGGIIDMIYSDLLQTNITIEYNGIYAKGGLCPSGIKLFDIKEEL